MASTAASVLVAGVVLWISRHRHEGFQVKKLETQQKKKQMVKKKKKPKYKRSQEVGETQPLTRFGTSGKEQSDAILYSRRREKKHSAISAKYIPVIITEHVDEYRDAIALCVKPTDSVLEVGCQVGKTTSKIAEHVSGTGFVAGADKSEFSIGEARTRFPHIPFHQVDAHDLDAVQRATGHRHFDKIFLDISGSVDVGVMAKLIERYQMAMKPSAIIIKSFKMVRLLNQCLTPNDYVKSLQAESDEATLPAPSIDREHRVLRSYCSHSRPPGSPSDLLARRPVPMGRAMTLWAAVCRTVLSNGAMKPPEELRLHLIGVDPTEEQDPGTLQFPFVTIFAQLACLAGVKRLAVCVVGPSVGLELEKKHLPQHAVSYEVRKDQSTITVNQRADQRMYHESALAVAPADLCVLFHPGLWGYPSWEESIRVLAMKQVPVVVTSYNEWEASDDYETVLGSEVAGVEWLWKPAANEWGSTETRPSGVEGRECRENSYWQCWMGNL